MIAGPALLLAALFLWLLGAHMRERRFFDRPDLARHPLFDPGVRVLGWVLLAAGLVVPWRASVPAAAAAGAILLVLGGWRRAAAGEWIRARRFRRDMERLRRAHPGLPTGDLLARAVLARHPEWGEDLAAQMALDYPDAARLAPVVARMEKGFRGFR